MLTVEASCLGGYDVNFSERIMLISNRHVRVAVASSSLWVIVPCCGQRSVKVHKGWFWCACGARLVADARYPSLARLDFIEALERAYEQRYDVFTASLYAEVLKQDLAHLMSGSREAMGWTSSPWTHS